MVAWRTVDGAAGLVSPADSTFFWLNPVATRIWELADGTRSIKAISEALCDEFEVDLETALRDTEALVEQLTAKGLLGAE